MKAFAKLILIVLSAMAAVALVGCGASKSTSESTHYERDDTTEVYTVDTAARGTVEQLSGMSYYAITAQPGVGSCRTARRSKLHRFRGAGDGTVDAHRR